MEKLYACISSAAPPSLLISVAKDFAYNIELKNGAVLFDVSGLENRIGNGEQIANRIFEELQATGHSGNVCVSRDAGTAILYANKRSGITVNTKISRPHLPVDELDIDSDTLQIFRSLGIRTSADLKAIPKDELVARYGLEFRKTLDLLDERSGYVLRPNLEEQKVEWLYDLDFAVADAERLIFVLGRGLSRVFEQTSWLGFSTEKLDIEFVLSNKTLKKYELRVSFPTLEKNFWLKLINLRISDEPPDAEISSINLICNFVRRRAMQRGLYSSTKPETENLLLTVGKIKRLVGNSNVGVPVLLNQRTDKPFFLDADALPEGKEAKHFTHSSPCLALNYFNPPLNAKVTIVDGRLNFLATKNFKGLVIETGGAWKECSQWWNRFFWQTTFWDVELDNGKIYRLSKNRTEWLVVGEYD